jgi:hypothetical protein
MYQFHNKAILFNIVLSCDCSDHFTSHIDQLSQSQDSKMNHLRQDKCYCVTDWQKAQISKMKHSLKTMSDVVQHGYI